ncbi:MAG: hypothetical protein KA419_10220 [Acidobacteria bacterium]|nr:hypothetical protein [Acidobacteriota bacterium]
MKRTLFGILTLVCLVAATAAAAGPQTPVSPKSVTDTRALWNEVNKAVSDGLPKTAVEKLDLILASAKDRGDRAEWMRATGLKTVLEANIQGNKPEEKITRLQALIAGAPEDARPLLKVLLADWYWQYFRHNRWRFLQRTRTAALDEKDFTTWDLPKLFETIDRLFQEVLAGAEGLKKTPVETFAGFLEPGTTDPKLRPTVYDFVSFEALAFYTAGEQAGARPEDAFEIAADSPAFGPRADFLAWAPPGGNADSPKVRALRLFQDVLRFHEADGNRAAVVDADLQRLRYVKNVAYGEGKNDRLIERLRELADEAANLEVFSLVQSALGRAWHEKGDFVKARDAALEGERRFPKSLGAQACRHLVDQVEAKSLSITGEKIVPTGRPDPGAAVSTGRPGPGEIQAAHATLRLTYRNCTRLWFRVVPDAWDAFFNAEYGHPNQLDAVRCNELLSRTPARAWTVDLPETPDYKPRTRDVAVPSLEPGYYRVFVSSGPRFTEAEHLQTTWLWVSSLALVVRPGYDQVDGLVVDAVTGEPVEGATVSLVVRKGSRFQFGPARVTAADGYYRFGLKGTSYSEMHVHARKGATELFDDGGTWVSRWQPEEKEQTVFFTDRSIYRPGQTVYFKGICVSADKDAGTYEVLPGRTVVVRFLDVNAQEVARQTLTTNDFGSFNGSFTAPADRLAGQMRLECEGPRGQGYFRVEEYKRPTFRVEVALPAEQVKLGAGVTVKGTATAYTGAPMDGASVRFRVVRTVRWPSFYSWFRPWRAAPAQEIAHGTVTTGKDGAFKVDFVAKPDPSVAEADDPAFVFAVYADVTDAAGETRSGAVSLTLGYKGFELALNASEPRPEGDVPFKLRLFARTLDGMTLPAAGTLRVIRLKEPPQPVRKSYLREMYGETEDPGAEDKFPDNWARWPDDRNVWEKAFETDGKTPAEPELSLPPGVYRVEAVAKDRDGKMVKTLLPLLVLPGWKASRCEVRLPFLTAVKSTTVEVGKSLDAAWGTGYDRGRCFVEIWRDREMLKKFWTAPGVTWESFRFPVDDRLRGGFAVRLTQVRENRDYTETHWVQVPWDTKELDLSFETFRSALEPGAKETFRVKVKGKTAGTVAAEMAAALYDASLDQFYGHGWYGFGFLRSNRFFGSQRFANAAQRFNVWRDAWNALSPYPKITYVHMPENLTEDYFYYGRVMAQSADARKDNFADGVARESTGMDFKAKGGAGLGAGSGFLGGMVGEKEESGSRNELSDLAKPAAPLSSTTTPAPALDEVKARANLAETAFFFPSLLTDPDGGVTLEFTMPEALTKWKFIGIAHTKDCRSGTLVNHLVTRKNLMVQPNAPRFVREGDVLEFTARVTNLSKDTQSGRVRLEFADLATDAKMDDKLALADREQAFEVPAGESRAFSWRLSVPVGAPPLRYTVKAAAVACSDGETGALPVLSSRLFVSESLPLWARGPETRTFRFDRLREVGAPGSTLEPVRLAVQMTSNPAWYAVQALPFLLEFPYECSEQVFNRLYANSLAGRIANSNPRIRQIFDAWKGTDALKSNLEKNEDLKSALLQETPWVLDAKDESAAKRRVGLLFDANTLESGVKRAWNKLKNLQLDNGAWPWFPGGRPDPFITLTVVTGFGRLRHLDVKVDEEPAVKALAYLDRWIVEIYRSIVIRDANHLTPLVAHYLYARSFFLKDRPFEGDIKEAVDYYLGQSRKYWLELNSRLCQAELSLALHRLGDALTARKILASLKERSVSTPELGMFWREDELSWWWWRAPIETQAMVIEALGEVTADAPAVEDCKVWLLKQKQARDWKTTKATADAVYALLLRGDDLLKSTEIVQVKLGSETVKPSAVEAGTGYWQERWAGPAVKPEYADVTVVKTDPGIAWGGVHFQYFEDMAKVTPHATNLSLEKTLFVKRDSDKGPTLEPVTGPLRVGDLVTVRVVLRTDRDMEYVHLKDLRGSGFEPTSVLSGYRYQDGLWYYQSTRDTASHFFIDYLPKGTYVFEYTLRVQLRGRYQSGMAEIGCMYAPEFGSHSGSMWVEVE